MKDKLIRAGFLRQSHSGIFHLLPLGRRVQDKLEHVIDYYMQDLGASRVALSTITSKDLWQKSGRLSQLEPELFSFDDRRGAKYMLSPTHEEEITTLVAKTVKSYKELPLRLYQITRKFRDELRPRYGLLRTREFTMKDLYTFDASAEAALETYNKVQSAYAGVFNALKLPVLVARASSGDMGGDLSHEYHLPTTIGEDTVVTCSKCDYTVNAEVAETRAVEHGQHSNGNTGPEGPATPPAKVWRGISRDRLTLVNAWYPGQLQQGTNLSEMGPCDVSIPVIKSVIPDLDASIDDVVSLWRSALAVSLTSEKAPTSRPRIINVVDSRLLNTIEGVLRDEHRVWPLSGSGMAKAEGQSTTITKNRNGQLLNLLTVRSGDGCPNCDGGVLRVQEALEVGHTFHLGTRYSEPLGAVISVPEDNGRSGTSEKTTLMQMGCHGIGVSRLIGAVVEHLADSKGLQWPRVIAPYEAVVISVTDLDKEAVKVYDEITAYSKDFDAVDAVLDDRSVSLAWKLKDADLVGYPVLIVLGKVWKKQTGICEVQCRRLGIKETVPLANLHRRVSELLKQL
ncbi:prolyl-tRNA synthetase [Colletotrichum graminicola M1.001]|uniref:proline--tRNA ligase n=1 Tax=Colletotrichum graminicola (strain M1.001 / M2 / FGSC 10212) TaxID=645133 RepID=E3QEY4_COLGM|nr:prolyl-tRNA synthetase [Colletotrichum graminicola M1.001]EFQ29205.1 prolyl-tRNA synthetase [Colletotrichum graminicola M1.001]